MIHNCHMEQTVTFPTRLDNTLDLFLTNRPSLINRCSPLPGISDHDAVFIETSAAAKRGKPVKRKIHLWKRADNEKLKKECLEFQQQFLDKYTIQSSIAEMWLDISTAPNSIFVPHLFWQLRSRGLTCLICPDIAHPRFCEDVGACASGEKCGMERKMDNFGGVSYSIGCRSEKIMSHHSVMNVCSTDLCNTQGCGETGNNYITLYRMLFNRCGKQMCNMDIGSIFGKRAEPDLHCCSDNLCNGHINRTLTTIQPTQTSTPVIPASTIAPVTLIPSKCTNAATSVDSPINCDFEKVDICNYMEDKKTITLIGGDTLV
ncbi:unnamed protein product [Mytilus edulis]|uniref:Uncharacterized protein n=1 Tax=Mytilus edulis TaxID=6550 RepID=A0A8S3QZP9_MYTED|nr:unnamed protein product [Mytilus edulis]